MPSVASVSVKYGRKFRIRKDDWVSFEALVTLTVSPEEANLTDPREVTAEAFAIARQAVREQATDLRRQIAEAAQRATEKRAAQLPVTFVPAEPPLRADISLARSNGHASAVDEPPF